MITLNQIKFIYKFTIVSILLFSSAFIFAENPEDCTMDGKLEVCWYQTNLGDIVAQNILGNRYYEGKGVKRNYRQAFSLYQEAAEDGLAEAQYNLAIMYYEGKGVEKNYEATVYWLQQSATQEYVLAELVLALIYNRGYEGQREVGKSFLWASSGYLDYHNLSDRDQLRLHQIMTKQEIQSVTKFLKEFKLLEVQSFFGKFF